MLQFALTLEYLEFEYYQTGVNTPGLIPEPALTVYQGVTNHEMAHVRLLEAALGLEEDEAKPEFDFTAGGMFNPFEDYGVFLALSQGFEDTGVRAYKGQAPALMGEPDVLRTALQIHSVEARHASIVRRLRGQPGWVEFDNTNVPALAATYAGEDNTTPPRGGRADAHGQVDRGHHRVLRRAAHDGRGARDRRPVHRRLTTGSARTPPRPPSL